MSSARLGLLAGLAVVVAAIVATVITTSAVWALILEWGLIVALVGWAVFAVAERLIDRHRRSAER
jgi:hypothetical protein